MKAILIDPDNKTVREVETTGHLNDIYRLLDCHMVECPITYSNGDTIYVNEEAWMEFNEDEPAGGWMFNGFSYSILGKALIVGNNEEGESADVRTPVSVILNQIHWSSPKYMLTQGIAMGLV